MISGSEGNPGTGPRPMDDTSWGPTAATTAEVDAIPLCCGGVDMSSLADIRRKKVENTLGDSRSPYKRIPKSTSGLSGDQTVISNIHKTVSSLFL